MRPTSPRKNWPKEAIDQIIRNALGLVADRDEETRDAFGRLLRQVRHRSDLLPSPEGQSM